MTKKPASLTSQLLVRKGDATPAAVPEADHTDLTADAPLADSAEGAASATPPAHETPDPVFAATPSGMQPAQEPAEEREPVRPEPEIVMEPAPEKKSSNKIAYIGGGAAIVVGVLVALNFFGTDKSGTSVAPLAKTHSSENAPTYGAAHDEEGESTSAKTLTPYTDAARGKTDVKIDANIEPTDPAIDDAVKSLALRPTTGPASSVAPVTVLNGEATKTVTQTAPAQTTPVKVTPAKPVVARATAPAPVVAPVKTGKVEAPKIAPVPASKQSAPLAQKGQYLIQLFSVRSEKDAQRGWAKTQSKHKALLSNEVLNLEKADLGERGTYYRVRFGAYDTSSAANSVCSALKKAKQDCLVKKLR